MGKQQMEVAYKTDWTSIYVLTVVNFLAAFKLGTANSSLWAYVTLYSNDTITESFFGVMQSVASIGNLAAAFMAGWFSNQIQHTKPAILTGKAFALLGGVIYLTVELVDSHQRVLFIAMEVCFGLGIGFSATFRTYVSMASSEKSRARAFGMMSLAHTCGHVVGPLTTGLFTRLNHPGYKLGSFGLHLNMYSGPVYLLISTVIVSVVLLLIFFDGKMRIMKTIHPIENELGDIKKSAAAVDPSTLPKNRRFDILAVVVCCATRFLGASGIVFGHSVSTPYMQAVFRWTRPQLVLISSIMQAFIGLIGVAWSLIYISGYLKNRLSERRAIILAIVMKLLFFVITYPWPLYQDNMGYEVLAVNETTNKSKVVEHGCKLAYEWCKYTPAINPYIYCISKVLLMGISIPLMHLALDILYSKILGPIKQGTMQGAFIICGDIPQVIGPIILTQVYQHFGVKQVWHILIACNLLILGLWLIFYNRMISSTRRMQQIIDTTELSTEE